MPAPMLRPETVRRGQPPRTVPFVHAWPQACHNGVAWNATRLAAEEAIVTAEVAPGAHEPPRNGRSSVGEYAFPFAPCGANGAGHHQGCTYCSETHARLQGEVRRNPDRSTMFIGVEKALNRRLRHREALAIYNHAGNWGLDRMLSDARLAWYDGQPMQGVTADPLGVDSASYANVLPYVERVIIIQAERTHDAMHNRAYQIWEQQRHNEEQVRLRLRSTRNINNARRVDALNGALTAEVEGVDIDAVSTTPAGYPLRANEDGECPCGCPWQAETIRRCRCHESSRYRNAATRKSPKHGVPFIVPKKAPIGINRRLVGVEVEFNEETDLSAWVMKWNGAVHSDGSCGWEAVTTPIAGGHVDACLRDLTRCLRSRGTSADERCGVHVHVNAQDVTWADMFRLLSVYSKLEPLLYLIAGQQRLDGTYSKACGVEYAAAVAQDNLAERKRRVMGVAFAKVPSAAEQYARQRPGKKDGGRYRGLNIMPWLVGRAISAPDTTVEFRMHRNSLEAGRLIGWTHLLAAIVEWCTKASDAEVKALPASPLKSLRIIAPGSVKFVLRRIAEWRGATTAEKRNRSTATGVRMPRRRISVTKGAWSLCAA